MLCRRQKYRVPDGMELMFLSPSTDCELTTILYYKVYTTLFHKSWQFLLSIAYILFVVYRLRSKLTIMSTHTHTHIHTYKHRFKKKTISLMPTKTYTRKRMFQLKTLKTTRRSHKGGCTLKENSYVFIPQSANNHEPSFAFRTR